VVVEKNGPITERFFDKHYNGFKMKIPNHIYTIFLLLLTVMPGMAIGQSPPEEQLVTVEIKKLALGATATCEMVKNGLPINKAAVFSSALKKVYCYTNFTSVPEKVFTFHNWYLRDRLKASIKLVLRPTRWSTYSAMELRSSDRGPWRVEVTDEEGTVLETLRFSIIE
jgi:hypothetical protein